MFTNMSINMCLHFSTFKVIVVLSGLNKHKCVIFNNKLCRIVLIRYTIYTYTRSRIAVSYTHLDVYKRQTADRLHNISSLFCALIIDVTAPCCSLIKKLFHFINDSLWHSLFSVSYTHLDVYKRQVVQKIVV